MLSGPFRYTAVVFALAAGVGSPSLQAQAPSPALTAVLAQMDAASKRFTNATAEFERDNYEKVVRDTTRQKGSMYIERGKGGTEFGAAEFELGPDGKPVKTPSKVINYGGGQMRMFSPAEKQVDAFSAGANQARYESFFALGFGGSGHDLAANWDITDGGPETLTDNGQPVKTQKLVLVSKDPGVQNTFTRVTIWIDPARDVSLKQVFETPSGDRQTATYTDIRLNGKLSKDVYKIPTGKDINVVRH